MMPGTNSGFTVPTCSCAGSVQEGKYDADTRHKRGVRASLFGRQNSHRSNFNLAYVHSLRKLLLQSMRELNTNREPSVGHTLNNPVQPKVRIRHYTDALTKRSSRSGAIASDLLSSIYDRLNPLQEVPISIASPRRSFYAKSYAGIGFEGTVRMGGPMRKSNCEGQLSLPQSVPGRVAPL